MSETKTEILTRKNAELRAIQARLRGMRRKLEPLSKASNCTIEIGKILLLLDFTIDQIKEHVTAKSSRKEFLGLKKITAKEAETFCSRHFEGRSVEEKCEEAQQHWLDKLEDQILGEREEGSS